MTLGAPTLSWTQQDIYLSLPCCNHIQLNGSLLSRYILSLQETLRVALKQYIKQVHNLPYPMPQEVW